MEDVRMFAQAALLEVQKWIEKSPEGERKREVWVRPAYDSLRVRLAADGSMKDSEEGLADGDA